MGSNVSGLWREGTMYCNACGATVPDDSMQCPECGAPMRAQARPVSPPMKMKNYLVESIVVTICCCLPFGIAAIVFAAQVNGKLQAGDIAGAQDAANKAKMFCWIGFGIGLLVNLIVIIVQALAVMASSGAQM